VDLGFLEGIMASPWYIMRSLIDISIVAYIIYRLLGLIKDTRAEQLLKGLSILIIFSAVVSYSKLELLGWLLNKLWIVFAITLPIVFQPELRRILEQLGRGRFFAFSTTVSEKETMETMIREIAEATMTLSRNKVGALIIMARETGIEEYLESGKHIDSLVSAALLINIFVPNTPLHDGAVVIKNGRISKAACFLPLSDNPKLDPEIGTRHRAGIGITEISDALALMVSEETGTISLANNGKITRYLDIKSLKEILSKELINEENLKESFWRRRWLIDGHNDQEKKHP
jgi:diadenylate cyclase